MNRVRLNEIMKDWKTEARVKSIILYGIRRERNEYDDSTVTIYVCTNRPGSMIGLHGSLVEKYRGLLSDFLKTKCHIHFIETDGIV